MSDIPEFVQDELERLTRTRSSLGKNDADCLAQMDQMGAALSEYWVAANRDQAIGAAAAATVVVQIITEIGHDDPGVIASPWFADLGATMLSLLAGLQDSGLLHSD